MIKRDVTSIRDFQIILKTEAENFIFEVQAQHFQMEIILEKNKDTGMERIVPLDSNKSIGGMQSRKSATNYFQISQVLRRQEEESTNDKEQRKKKSLY